VDARRFERVLHSRLEDIGTLADALDTWGESLDVPMATLGSVNLMLDELITNVILHGYGPQGQGSIEVCIDCLDQALDVTLRDQAPPFDPLSVPEPDTTLDIDAREIGGLGVHFVRRMADVVDYHHDGQSNVLHLRKNFPPTGGTA